MCANTKSYLDSIEDFILNQDKIVTYKWLSQKLQIHPNTSKQLLYTFSNNTDERLLVTVLICGIKDGGVKFYIVNQSEKDKVKSSLENVISEHVYSVQKATSSVSTSDIYQVDSMVESKSSQLCSISPRIVEHREFNVVLPEKTTAAVSSAVLPTTKPQQQKVENKGKSIIVSPTKSCSKSKIEGGAIKAMFIKQAAQQGEKKKNETSKEKEDKQVLNTEKVSESKKESESDEAEEPAIKTVLKTPVSKEKNASKSKSKKRKSKKQDDGDTSSRKRKRIVLASDSDSDDDADNNEQEMDVEEEPEPEEAAPQTEIPDSDEEVIPPTPFGDKVKRRVRKQIDRTFTDEEGFVITKKEYVYESCSDEEINKESTKEDGKTESLHESNKVEEKPKQVVRDDVKEQKETEEPKAAEAPGKSKGNKSKREKNPVKGKVKSPKKIPPNNKQRSIMSFFSKK